MSHDPRSVFEPISSFEGGDPDDPGFPSYGICFAAHSQVTSSPRRRGSRRPWIPILRNLLRGTFAGNCQPREGGDPDDPGFPSYGICFAAHSQVTVIPAKAGIQTILDSHPTEFASQHIRRKPSSPRRRGSSMEIG